MLNQYLTVTYQYIINAIVCQVVSTPPPPLLVSPPISENPPSSHLTCKSMIPSSPYWQKCNCEIKFNKYYPFFFKFTQKYMLGNVSVNKIHTRQCLYIISLYFREGFSHPFTFFIVSKGILHIQFQQLGRKDFSMEQLPIDSYMLPCKPKNSISINQ